MKKRRQWTTYSGSGKRVAPRTRTSRVSRGKEMGVPRLWVQLIVCGALFVALIGLKLLMPGNLSALRGTLGQWLVRDADFISAFSAVGRAASGEQDWGDSLSEAYVAVFGGESKAQEVSGNLIGMTVSEQDVSDLTSARELPALAVGEQRILGFSYTTPLSGTVTSPFGWRDDPNGAGECFHYGMDIAGEEGASVACFADGTVGTVGESNILGNYVTVNHEGGFSTLYAHCSAITASAGQSVKKGDAIDIQNGADVTEDYDSSTEEIPYERVEDNNYWNGSLHVYIDGQNGVRTTKTGKVSGKTVTEDTTPAVNEEYKIYTANTGDDKVIALTFDDGPWKDTTAEILDVLKENDAHATFFTIGKQIADHSDVVKRAHDEGHEICTHTWDHAAGSGQGVNLTYMTADEQIQEVQKGFQAIKDVIGEDPVRIMRAPGGNFKGDIVWTLQPYIDAEIGWNVDTEDWRRPGADTIASRIMKAKPGSVILMHDGGGDRSQTVEALKKALPQLKQEGYRFVTISELLQYDPPADSSVSK